MSKKRIVRRLQRPRSELPVERILEWADRFHARHGRWPNANDGQVEGDLFLTWSGVNEALRQGYRGLPRGSSIARLLSENRGHRNVGRLPDMTEEQILQWADAFYRCTKRWPTTRSGPILNSGGETWPTVNKALEKRTRGLKGPSSLAKLLERRRGVPRKRGCFVSHLKVPILTETQILRWADAWHARTNRWPTAKDGPVAPGLTMTWAAVSCALHEGRYTLPGGMSLAQLWVAKRGHRNVQRLPKLSEAQIMAWAREHRRRTGKWPNKDCGPVIAVNGEVWLNIDMALRLGRRQLAGGSSLAQLLAKRCGVRNRKALPRLSDAQILKWADDHHRRTGFWPRRTSGKVLAARGETWSGVSTALWTGIRGLGGGSSLAQLLQRERGVRNNKRLPPLTPQQILAWAKAHFYRTGKLPNAQSGEIPNTGGTTWRAIEKALRNGG
ncbi:MAG: hypothetical protein HY040_06890, partial [Planctomycetes bacterium]|nr:hypothetical protein [Planctomycetota bacterium]